MPIYELRCKSCGHEYEELVLRRGELDELRCPSCGAQVGLLLSSFASAGSTKTAGQGASSCGSGGFS